MSVMVSVLLVRNRNYCLVVEVGTEACGAFWRLWCGG